MKVHKTTETGPSLQKTAPRSQTEILPDPLELLNSLRTKQRLLTQLEREGLVQPSRQIREELLKTIQDLEILIPKLEVA